MSDDYWGGDSDDIEGEFEEVEGDSDDELEEEVLEAVDTEDFEELEEIAFDNPEDAEEIEEIVETETGFSLRVLSREEVDWSEFSEEDTDDTDNEWFRAAADSGDDEIAHFDFEDDALEYVKGAPFGVLYIVETEDGFDVHRDEDYEEDAA